MYGLSGLSGAGSNTWKYRHCVVFFFGKKELISQYLSAAELSDGRGPGNVSGRGGGGAEAE